MAVKCDHIDREYTWEEEQFSNTYKIEYRFFICKKCGIKEYDHTYKFVKISKQEDVGPAVSKSLKARYAKDGYGLSLKEFIRYLVASGDEEAKLWWKKKG